MKITHIISILILSACASVPPVCKPEGARDAGVSQAMSGNALNFNVGSACEDEHVAIFKDNFQAGYMEGKNRFCSAPHFRQLGEGHGIEGKEAQYSSDMAKICDNEGSLATSYRAGHSSGLGAYCSTGTIQNDAQAYGMKGQRSEFQTDKFQICGAKKLAALKSAHTKGHQAGLADFCSGKFIADAAFKVGQSGEEADDITAQYQLCSAKQIGNLSVQYKKHHSRGLAEFCGETNMASEAKKLAATDRSPVPPAKVSACFAKFPESRASFDRYFKIERDAHVAAQCTFHKGTEAGRSDAQRSNAKSTAMPGFCDKDLFSVYLNGYLEGWKNEKARHCDEMAAYNKGIQDGQRRQAAAFSPSSLCPAENHGPLGARYREGYQIGNNQATMTLSSINSSAEGVCLGRGYSRSACAGVTSMACIEMGHQPPACRFRATNPAVSEICLRKGYPPNRCQNVTNMGCMKAGGSPESCR